MSNSLKEIRIGTRGSPLALVQAEMVQAALSVAEPNLETEIVVIKTSGDWRPEDGEVRLSTEAGGKGQFAKEIEEALLAGAIDCAVHSMKDMETNLPEGLVIPCVLPREDARDAMLVHESLGDVRAIEDLPEGATVGTASVRRQAFLLAQRSDLNIVPLRGNVETRIEKLRAKQVDVTILAMAGLNRLDLAHTADVILSIQDFWPAAAQGAVGIEIREKDEDILAVFSQLNCKKTHTCVEAERAVLRVLDGSCHTPIAAHAILENGTMNLKAAIASLDGKSVFKEETSQNVQNLEEAVKLGTQLGEKLKSQIPEDLLNQRIEAA